MEKILKFGASPLSEKEELLKDLSFCKKFLNFHKDFDKFIELIGEGKKTAVLIGFNPLTEIHLGHTITFRIALELQEKYGSKIFIIISDFEGFIYSDNQEKYPNRERVFRLIREILSVGFDLNKTKVLLDSENPDLFKLALKISGQVNLNTLKAIYGIKQKDLLGKIFSIPLQVSQILSPNFIFGEELEGILTIVGKNEDTHLRLIRDVAAKFNLRKPMALFSDFLQGLDNLPMSRKRPQSAIYLSDTAEQISSKIKNLKEVSLDVLKQYEIFLNNSSDITRKEELMKELEKSISNEIDLFKRRKNNILDKDIEKILVKYLNLEKILKL